MAVDRKAAPSRVKTAASGRAKSAAPAVAGGTRARGKAPADKKPAKPPVKQTAPPKKAAPAGKATAKPAAATKQPGTKRPQGEKVAAPKKAEAKKPEAKKAQPKKVAAPKKAEAKKPAPAKKRAVKKPEVKKEVRPAPPPSPFVVGDKVVYPHHGAAVITRKERVEFQGQRTDYFVLEVATDQLILKVPVHKAVERGVRPVISRPIARKVLATFKEPPEEAGANWSRWYKLLTEKINSGDIFQVAEVVRDLTFAQQTKGISPALKRMLSKARLILASELRFALDVTEEEAMRRLDKALPRTEAAEEL